MSPENTPRIEYIEARRVLLDALDALRPHLDAVVLVGAQAVYLRTTGRLEGYQPFTTDADIVLDPGLLADIPPLGDAMADAGFVLTDEPGIWEARFNRPGFDDEIVVPVDLIVPRSSRRRPADAPRASPAGMARPPPARALVSLAPSSTTAHSNSLRSSPAILGRSP